VIQSVLQQLEHLMAAPVGTVMWIASSRQNSAWDPPCEDPRFEHLPGAHANDDQAAPHE